MKAFLSHSSMDKEFVEAVAKELGRQFCVFDKYSFENGEDFKSSIEKGLDDSSIFVLFASQEALKSVWVDVEINEAWYARLNKSLHNALVYIIDSSVKTKDVPEWLSRGLIQPETVPKRLARDIRFHLNKAQWDRQHPYFVGRSSEMEQLEESLTPWDSNPPHVFFVGGLPGIGRRSLIRQIVPSLLNLKREVEIRVGAGDSINDICISISDFTEPYSTKEGFERIISTIKNLTPEDSVTRILDNLRSMVAAGELPLLIDTGGILDEDGYVRKPIDSILRRMASDDTAYLGIVTTRRPKQLTDLSFPAQMINHMGENETKRLLAILGKNAELEVTPSEISDLSTYVAGYPPAAYFAIHQAKNYGIELVAREKAQLVQFTTGIFLKHLQEISLSVADVEMLRVLSLFSPLPLPVLAEVVSEEIAVVHESMFRLIDLALVIPTPSGHYRIADPIASASIKSFGFPLEEVNRRVGNALAKYLLETEVTNARLELSRVVFRAALLGGDAKTAASAEFLATDIILLAETNYHSGNYREAERWGAEAVKLRPENSSARRYLVRALIQQEKWQEADEQIEVLKKYGPMRDVHFLHGFLERKRNNFKLAAEHFEAAEAAGVRGAAVSRELALCYHSIGENTKALERIRAALDRHPDNPFLVDLWVQIAIRLDDKDQAQQALSRLKLIDSPAFYKHRLSTFALNFGSSREALEYAREAVKSTDTPAFEMIAQLIVCEIEANNLDLAEELLIQLDREFRDVRHDIRVSLRCKYEIARHNFKAALGLSDQIQDKESGFFKKIRYDALTGELRESSLTDANRGIFEIERDLLEDELRDFKDRSDFHFSTSSRD